MLLRENYSAEHIAKLRKETGADPSILERTVFAFGLLEAIRSVDMPFIFNENALSLCEIIGVSKRTSERALKSLQEKGFIERQGSKRDGIWIVKK